MNQNRISDLKKCPETLLRLLAYQRQGKTSHLNSQVGFSGFKSFRIYVLWLNFVNCIIRFTVDYHCISWHSFGPDNYSFTFVDQQFCFHQNAKIADPVDIVFLWNYESEFYYWSLVGTGVISNYRWSYYIFGPIDSLRNSIQITTTSLFVAALTKQDCLLKIFNCRRLLIGQIWQAVFTKSVPNEICNSLSFSKEFSVTDRLFCACKNGRQAFKLSCCTTRGGWYSMPLSD